MSKRFATGLRLEIVQPNGASDRPYKLARISIRCEKILKVPNMGSGPRLEISGGRNYKFIMQIVDLDSLRRESAYLRSCDVDSMRGEFSAGAYFRIWKVLVCALPEATREQLANLCLAKHSAMGTVIRRVPNERSSASSQQIDDRAVQIGILLRYERAQWTAVFVAMG